MNRLFMYMELLLILNMLSLCCFTIYGMDGSSNPRFMKILHVIMNSKRPSQEEINDIDNILENNPAILKLRHSCFGYYHHTLLHMACIKNKIQVVELLIEHGALIDAGANLNGAGATPVMYAAFYDHIDIVELLGSCGANICLADSNKRTALHCAAQDGRGKPVSYLIENGANIDAQFGDHVRYYFCKGERPLDCAYAYGHKAIGKQLEDMGCEKYRRTQ